MKTSKFVCIWMCLVLGWVSVSCEKEEIDAGPTAEEVAAMRAERDRLAREKREKERAANRERTMERLRQEDMEKQRAKELAKARAEKAAEEAKAEAEAEGEEVDWQWIEGKMVARLGAIGSDMGTVRLSDGRVLKEVMVKGATSNRLSVYHSGGVADVAYGDLPSSWRTDLQYDARESALVAEGEALPELPLERLVRVREQVVDERMRLADAEAAKENVLEALTEDAEPGIEESAGDSDLLAKRREIAQRLNEEVHKLSQMKDAGFKDGHPAVEKQKALIANGERALQAADAAVMAERRRRVGG